VEATGENQYAIGMAIKIGPVSAKFTGKIALSDIKAPESYRIFGKGEGGFAGFASGGATSIKPSTPTVPAKNDAIAAMPSAAPARPLRAI
jgi:carbon monoxide dehydrogenase subunit G